MTQIQLDQNLHIYRSGGSICKNGVEEATVAACGSNIGMDACLLPFAFRVLPVRFSFSRGRRRWWRRHHTRLLSIIIVLLRIPRAPLARYPQNLKSTVREWTGEDNCSVSQFPDTKSEGMFLLFFFFSSCLRRQEVRLHCFKDCSSSTDFVCFFILVFGSSLQQPWLDTLFDWQFGAHSSHLAFEIAARGHSCVS